MTLLDPLVISNPPRGAAQSIFIDAHPFRWVNFGAWADQVSTTTAAFNFTKKKGTFLIRATVDTGACYTAMFTFDPDLTTKVELVAGSSTYFAVATADTKAALIVTSGELGINNRLTSSTSTVFEIMKIG